MCGPCRIGPGHKTAGFGLVEVMVGVVIALVTMLAVHRVVIASETTRRNAQSDAEAQQVAQFALARLSFDVANAGAGIVTAARALAACPVTGDFTAMTRPIAVVFTSGGAPDVPDSVVLRYAVGNATVLPERFAAAAPSGAAFALRTAMGFAAGDQIIVSDRRGACARTTVTATRGPVTLDPASVARIPFARRSNSSTPSSRSSRRSCFDTAGWLTMSRSAAPVTVPVSATA